MKRSRLVLMLLPLLFALLGLLGLAGIGGAAIVRRLQQWVADRQPPANFRVLVPPGFVSDVYATAAEMEIPTVITFGPDDALYLMDAGGKIARFEDTDADGVAENSAVIFDNRQNTVTHSVGMTFDRDGKLFISYGERVATLEDSDGDKQLDKLTNIVEGLPSLMFPDHSNNGIAFGPDGKLYIGVGATTDHGPLNPDYPYEGSVLRMNPDGSDLEVFANGFRNPYDITFSPDGELFAADNNPSTFSKRMQYLPPEELNHVRQGKYYGFPDYYGRPPQGVTYPGVEAPITDLYAGVGSAGIAYYADGPFPARYHDGLFLAQWGTGANVALDRGISNGQNIVFIALQPTDDGTFTADWEVFANFNLGTGAYRPVDVTVGKDGALYALEWSTATVYRIYYDQELAARIAQATPTPSPLPVVRPEYPPERVAAGEKIYASGASNTPACLTCHVLDPNLNGLGPSLLAVYKIAGARVPGLSAEEYIRQSIANPNAFIPPGYSANYMYQTYGAALRPDQVDALVAFVLTLPEEGKPIAAGVSP